MDFGQICRNKLSNVPKGDICECSGKIYFSLERILSLPSLIREFDFIDDLVITPYYISNNERLELYEYVLSIRTVSLVQEKVNYFLDETGKKSIDEIDEKILEKLDNTYYEVLKNDKQNFIKCLERYINYMLENESKLVSITRKEQNEVGVKSDIFYDIL